MKNLLCACVLLAFGLPGSAQSSRIKADKYPSLLWEITGNQLRKPSYLFGTMHVSSKMVFHLSDSFYLGIRNAQVVALETNPSTWQEDFSKYDLDGDGIRQNFSRYYGDSRYGTSPQDFLTVNTLKLPSFEKTMEAALYSNPAMLNSFLYRSNHEAGSDFEEDTYLDLHIFQAGRKLGKKICGVEDFHGSMQLVKEAYRDASKEKKRQRTYDHDDDLSYARLEEAYRTGNLDLLDTINKVNSQSAAFDEKFLYKRNEIQALSIDSILRSGTSLFAGVGAAHLPGERGVIEMLRSKGYKLRPIRMNERDRYHKESIERIRVPVQFSKQVANDGFYAVMVPGRLYGLERTYGEVEMKQYADMTNGSYYMVTRIATRAAIQGQTEAQVQRKLDSVLYENIPGKILSKKSIVRNGYRGYDITNRTRRGDLQRYHIFITPFEIILFKMSGTSDYIKMGTEAEQFFSSIQLKEAKQEWKAWSPSYGGFEVEMPHQPLELAGENRIYAAKDPATGTAFEVIRTDVHNHDFLEEDAFDLSLMEESFASSENIARHISKQPLSVSGYPALEATYRLKDSSFLLARFLIQGPHYYTLLASAKADNKPLYRFIRSFAIRPFVYGDVVSRVDTTLQFRVLSPVALEKAARLQMYPEEIYSGESDNDDDSLLDDGRYLTRTVADEKTGEKVHVAFFRPSPYFSSNGQDVSIDSVAFKKEWIVRYRKEDTLQNGLVVAVYELGHPKSSRVLRGKSFLRQGMGYTLETATDTLSRGSTFLSSFFQHFVPLDSLQGVDINTRKTGLFFSQFFSADSVVHRTAVKNLGNVEMDSADFKPLQKAIASLTWKEKAYLALKKELIGKLATVKTFEAADFLKSVYKNAGDTAELQYAALETLLAQQTAYAYQTFAGILQDDPPVLDIPTTGSDYTVTGFQRLNQRHTGRFSMITQNGSFFDNLRDSLPLTAAIFPALLPLISVADYEQPLTDLLGILIDSNLIRPSVYESLLPKFMLEAKQLLKKQLIQEKARSIEKAKNDEEGKKNLNVYNADEDDNGNRRLSLYASFLFPFRDKNAQVESILQQLLRSADKRLRYNTTMLLVRNNQSVPDSLLDQFAGLDEFRHQLYTDLQALRKESLFPAGYRSQQSLARSRLIALHSYRRPDTVVFLQTLPLQDESRDGVVYFFKYKEKEEDNTWKIGTAGLYPKDSTQLYFKQEGVTASLEIDKDDFTELSSIKLSADKTVAEQIELHRKRLLYSRRKSAQRFYENAGQHANSDYLQMR
jgi:uncharacterized protein YbaP (TraB family)